MSSPAMSQSFAPHWPNAGSQDTVGENGSSNEDGVSVRPMRLKVLYTFDDQNKTNCLARWPHVLQIQTIAMDETASIGVIELKTCIQAIVQCSPELVARLGQDYTVYAYDFSEYDNPLVGQGMLSWALAAASTTPDGPAHQSNKLITGRVCKNILGLFANGVKETLEVKLRLIPVPTVLQSEYINAMEKYRELSKVVPPGLDLNDWMAFLQSNPSLNQLANMATPTPMPNPVQTQQQRDGTSMEVVNQLLSPNVQQQQTGDPMSLAGASIDRPQVDMTAGEKPNNGSRPASRTAVKRPRKSRLSKANQNQPHGGDTSGYEEGTDGDDVAPASKKRAKITKADWSSKSTIGDASDSLRVAASTAGSLRLFRPIAINPALNVGSQLQEMPRAPTPVPRATKQKPPQSRRNSQAGSRKNSFSTQPAGQRVHVSPYLPMERPEDQPRISIESTHTSPEQMNSPADTPPEIGSSPPVMRTRPPSVMQSSPPCPSSPVLPQMPRTDSGFMSGTLEELFGEDEEGNQNFVEVTERSLELPQHVTQSAPGFDSGLNIQLENPGPVEFLPTKVPVHKPISMSVLDRENSRDRSYQASRGGSVFSEDGQQSLPPLRRDTQSSFPAINHPFCQAQSIRGRSQGQSPVSTTPAETPTTGYQSLTLNPQTQPAGAPLPGPSSRTMARTASTGSLLNPESPASEVPLPRSGFQRSQTWSAAENSAFGESRSRMDSVEAPVVSAAPIPKEPLPLSHYMMQLTADLNPIEELTTTERQRLTKKALMRQKLEFAIANGETPPFCNNCGAIETPTWRKFWSQDHDGVPPYCEYSDQPGKVTYVNILTRDTDGQPASYQIIKKTVLNTEDKAAYAEYLLCNPCGIWLQKYKSHRPEEKWTSNDSTTRKSRHSRSRTQYPKSSFMTSDANFPPSDAYQPQSEAYFPAQEAQIHGVSREGVSQPPQINSQRPSENPQPQRRPSEVSQPQREASERSQTQREGSEKSQAQDERRRSASSQPSKRLKAMTSDAASAALRRAIQSSPARWQGTRKSPIEVGDDGMGSTRRLLFPSPGKDNSLKVLGEMVTNIVQVSTEFRVPDKVIMDAIDKENCPPAIDEADEDAELLRMVEEEMARPSTPTGKSPKPNPFKTPTRPTPNHRPITRSVSRSIRSGKSPGQLLSFGQHTPTPRRSPRHQYQVFESPFTATLNQLMSEANNNSPTQNIELDFNMPTLLNNDYNMDELFSTNVPMPSSPSRMFSLYEDPVSMNINWDDFGSFVQQKNKEPEIKEEPQSPRKLQDSPRKLGESESQETAEKL